METSEAPETVTFEKAAVTTVAVSATKTSRIDALRATIPSSWRAEHMPAHLRHTEGKLKNARGQSLSYVSLFPDASTPVRGVLLYLHGINEHCRRYYHLYEQLCESGFGVLAYDLLSHGQSDTCDHNIRAHAKRFHYFVDDTNELLTFAKESIFPTFLSKERYPSLPPLVLAGMSFGTLVSLHTVLSEKHTFSGIVLVAPAVSVEWTTTLRVQSVFAKPLSVLLPKLRLVPGVNREWVCRDKYFMEDFENDPLTVGGEVTSRMGEQSLNAMNELKKDLRVEQADSKFCSVPILIMMGSNDKVTSLSIATEFANRIANRDKEFKVFEGPYHALFDDPEKDAVFDHLIQWLQSRFPEPNTTAAAVGGSDVVVEPAGEDVKTEASGVIVDTVEVKVETEVVAVETLKVEVEALKVEVEHAGPATASDEVKPEPSEVVVDAAKKTEDDVANAETPADAAGPDVPVTTEVPSDVVAVQQ